MKKIFLSICVLFTMVIGFAQKKWAIEVKAGANIFSNADFNNNFTNELDRSSINFYSISFRGKSGFMGGVLGTYFLANGFAVKSGFLYDRRGFKIKMKLYDTSPRVLGAAGAHNYTDDYINIKEKFTISALTIPFYGQYEIDNKLKILFYAGPYISIPLNTKVSVEDVNTGTDIERISVDIENPNVDFGFSVGTGLIIPMNNTLDFICDLSYKIGIDKLSMEDGRLYDLGASVGLRYRF